MPSQGGERGHRGDDERFEEHVRCLDAFVVLTELKIQVPSKSELCCCVGDEREPSILSILDS